MIAIQERIQRTAESILENEALTADLDDEAAQVLLDYGWPGNIRQLKAMAYDAVSTHSGGTLSMETFKKNMGLNREVIKDPDKIYVGQKIRIPLLS